MTRARREQISLEKKLKDTHRSLTPSESLLGF